MTVEAPDGTRFHLDKDFNINEYSGEVTRRWVLYGPTGAGLVPAGDYRFVYYKEEELVLTQVVSYTPETVGFPKDIKWLREGDDLVVEWTPPQDTTSDMWYKVILFPDGGNVISDIIDWDASSARLRDIPLSDGARGRSMWRSISLVATPHRGICHSPGEVDSGVCGNVHKTGCQTTQQEVVRQAILSLGSRWHRDCRVGHLEMPFYLQETNHG